MIIREFKESDRQAVKDLWAEFGLIRAWNDPDRDIDRKVAFQPKLFHVASIDRRIIASAMIGYDGHRGSVFYFAIAKDYQRAGHGKAFMEHIEHVLVGLGCPKVNILVRSNNDKVLEFYNRLGYQPDSVQSLGKRLISDE